MIDSHAHLTSESVYENIDEVLQRAQSAGLSSIVNICTDQPTLKRGLLLAEKEPWIFNTAAITPHDVATLGDTFFDLVAKAAKEKKLVAIGETGLDYYYTHSPKEIQIEFFIKHLELAKSSLLPVVIHCREAFDDFFSIIDQHYPGLKGVLHCFTGTVDEVKELIKRDWYVSFSGIVTFKKSKALRQCANLVPLDRILIETDTPYLAPQSKRGKPNEPSYIEEIAEMIASVKGQDLETVKLQTSQNTKTLFGI